MLLVVSGASGVGKTTARLIAERMLPATYETAELHHFGPIPDEPSVAWRQETLERVVQRAIALDRDGRHLLLAGDPVPAGEVLAVPSADQIDIAVCLFDVDEATHRVRLAARHDPPEAQQLHLAFAEWMRQHAVDPDHRPEAVTTNAWTRMRWDRWIRAGVDDRWRMSVLDMSGLDAADTARALARWCEDAVAHRVPVFTAGWHR